MSNREADARADADPSQSAVPRTPELIGNRPELPAILYRVGTYATFRQTMLEAIGRTRGLEAWTTRNSDDFGIALLEMWAYLSDILTFYQERIANEAFLRTASLRESVLRLAALLDYRLAPGMAATAYLAFLLEEDATVGISEGLRVQSVPGQDEKPQKFETDGQIIAKSRLSQVRIYPEPDPAIPFEEGKTEAILRPSEAPKIAEVLAPGDRIVLFDTGVPGVEELEVRSLRTEDGHTFLSWTPAVGRDDWSATTRAFRSRRKLRVFGYNAPSIKDWEATPDSSQPGGFKWTPQTRKAEEYEVKSEPISLDGRYDDLKPGTRLLAFAAGSTPQLLTIAAVGQNLEELYPLSDTVTQVSFSEQTFNAFDRRKAVLYELLEPEIAFWGLAYGEKVSGQTIYANIADLTEEDLEGEEGRPVILADAQGKVCVAELQTAEEVDYDGDGEVDHLQIPLTGPLAERLDGQTARLYGNVTMATHGESVADEVLGNGDASLGFQSFPVRKSPVTFVPRPGAVQGAGSTLQVRVGGVLWDEVRTFYDYGSDERVFTTRIDNDGVTTVRFGDGVTGARLPSGRNNVLASYRKGLGRDGNVRSNSLTTLLDRPVGLKRVTNPMGAEGGAEPESLESARVNAPNTVRTFGRIVSLRDFEDAARALAGVAKARASSEWSGEGQAVRLIVAGDEGAKVGPALMSNLIADLDARRDPNRLIRVEPHRRVPIEVVALIRVDPDYESDTVRKEADKALRAYFAFESLDFGQSIHLSDVYRVLQDVEGVAAVDVNRLQFKDAAEIPTHAATEEPVQGHLEIHPGEMAVIEHESDASVTVG